MDEYERLLSERFTRDPDVAAAPMAEAVSVREERLGHLYQKLFGFMSNQARGETE